MKRVLLAATMLFLALPAPAFASAAAAWISKVLLPVPAPPITRTAPRIAGSVSAAGVRSVCGADMPK